MFDKDPQYRFTDLERKLNAQIDSLRSDLVDIQTNVDSLGNTVNTITTTSFAEIGNLLPNSFPEWSKDAYTNLGVDPSTVSDDNREAFGWFRAQQSTTPMSDTTAQALKADGHSEFLEENSDDNIPRWILPEGHIEYGGRDAFWDLNYKLPTDFVYPGMVFYVQFEAMLRTANLPSDVQAFAAFYDNTAGQDKIIEGGTFAITGSYEGAAGANTVEYQVKAFTDSGEEAISNILSFPNVPSVFTQNNRIVLNFRGAPGYFKFEIYKHDTGAGKYYFQFEIDNSIDGTYFDVGNAPIREAASFPGVATPPRAYAKTRTFQPGASNFVRHSLTIQVPTTYDSSLTASGSQWFKFGFTNLCADYRQVLVRKFGVSLGDGGWSRAAYDNQQGIHSIRTATASSSPSGDSGGGTDPPSPIGSGGHCVLMDSIVLTDKGEMTLKELRARCRTEDIFCRSAGVIGGRVIEIRKAYASRVLRIKTAGSEVVCTLDHPFILNERDIYGTTASSLKAGDDLQLFDGTVKKEKILEIEALYGDFEVGVPSLQGSHICVLNKFISHNKSEFDPNA